MAGRLQCRRTLAEKPAWGASVIRLAISVEGQTEEEFVKKLLRGHLYRTGVNAWLDRLESLHDSDTVNLS